MLLLPLPRVIPQETTCYQGWEFANRFSEQIAHFLRKNKRMSDSQKNEQFAHLLIFFSDLSDSLMAAHFW